MELLEWKPCKCKLDGTMHTGQSSFFFKTASSSKQHLQWWKIALAPARFSNHISVCGSRSKLKSSSAQIFPDHLPSFSWPSFSLWPYFWPHLLQPSSHPGYEFHLFLEPRLQCKINRWALCIEMCTDRGAKQQGKDCPLRLSHNTVSEKPSTYQEPPQFFGKGSGWDISTGNEEPRTLGHRWSSEGLCDTKAKIMKHRFHWFWRMCSLFVCEKSASPNWRNRLGHSIRILLLMLCLHSIWNLSPKQQCVVDWFNTPLTHPPCLLCIAILVIGTSLSPK